MRSQENAEVRILLTTSMKGSKVGVSAFFRPGEACKVPTSKSDLKDGCMELVWYCSLC